MNTIIGITGPSGVGKSTIAKIIMICLGHQDSIILSGDDAHKWERSDENWNFFTHLNPFANNLDQEYHEILNLKKGKPINRSRYDHSNGKFTEKSKVSPKKFIVYEGLHTMHDSLVELIDLSFYIEVDKPLKNEWKISRDIKKRGYSIDQIIKTIENRKKDERKFIEPQREKCDVVLKFKKTLEGKINLSFDYVDPNLTGLINKIKKLYSLLEEFVCTSNLISSNVNLTQNKGGNLSFKFEDIIIITESGSSFGEVSYFQGFGFYDIRGNSIFQDQRRPSMEIDCHMQLGPCCLHTHPLHVLSILCSKECDAILHEIFEDVAVMEYFPPGSAISENLKVHRNVFLKNHGIFISRDTIHECLKDSLKFDQKSREFLIKKVKSKNFLFPDSFVLEVENRFYHSYVKDLIRCTGLTPNPLGSAEIEILDNMEEEKYRRSLK